MSTGGKCFKGDVDSTQTSGEEKKGADDMDNKADDVFAQTASTMNGVMTQISDVPMSVGDVNQFNVVDTHKLHNVDGRDSFTDVVENTTSKTSDRQPSTNARYRRGCLLLGTDHVDHVTRHQSGGDDEDDVTVTYLTQYGIDHSEQSEGLCSEVILDECAPCCRGCCGHEDNEEDRKRGLMMSAVWILVAAIRSEIFLYTLHVTSIVLGAVKEAIGLRFTDTTLNLIQSAVETSATLLLIILRMFNAYIGYRRVHRSLKHVIHFDDHSPYCLERGNGASCKACNNGRGSEEVHIVSIRQWMIAQLLAGVVLVAICLGCFFIFLYYLHLGWTILSNNFCMITITVLSSLYAARVTIAVTRIIEDLHKVVIYDGQLIILESYHTTTVFDGNKYTTTSTIDGTDNVLSICDGQPASTTAAYDNGLKFVYAVNNTRLFYRPSYITYCGENVSIF